MFLLNYEIVSVSDVRSFAWPLFYSLLQQAGLDGHIVSLVVAVRQRGKQHCFYELITPMN